MINQAKSDAANQSLSLEEKIDRALCEIEEKRSDTGGYWLEHLTRDCAPLIADWDIIDSWRWEDWPELLRYYKSDKDQGIDVVALNKEGKYVAIQCKTTTVGRRLSYSRLVTFIGTSENKIWVERWLVTTGEVEINRKSIPEIDPQKPIKHVAIEHDLQRQKELGSRDDPKQCDHCSPEGGLQTIDCMQAEVVRNSVELLRKQAEGPTGKSRGKIILPCGTGKSRIALRIIEVLGELGDVSVVLCPSIALVAQLRREFLFNHHEGQLQVMSVCSDSSVAPGSDLAKNPTIDTSASSVNELKGFVTTNPDEIADWIKSIINSRSRIGVIFGTYQSSHRIADALAQSRCKLTVMIADEAHRTSGLRRIPKIESELRDFTVCHNDDSFPVKHRIYQTATPKTYGLKGKTAKNDSWIVRDMDDNEVFGPVLARKSYLDAVKNKWLSDYRIIAIGVQDQDAFDIANNSDLESNRRLPASVALRGLALALCMGGFLRKDGIYINSSISFVNTIKRSKELVRFLRTDVVRDWVKRYLQIEAEVTIPANYTLEHLDAKDKVVDRIEAKTRLAAGVPESPHGIVNVGIFGEGTDAPSLSAVGFLEPRKSPVDVVQAVGRVMRRSSGKDFGYILCPVTLRPGVDAETSLRNSQPKDGWQELGQVLLALRSHDGRIESELSGLMKIYLPDEIEDIPSVVTIGSTKRGQFKQAEHYKHTGKRSQTENAVAEILNGSATPESMFECINTDCSPDSPQPIRIVSGKRNEDGSIEMREGEVVYKKTTKNADPIVDMEKSKKRGIDMLNGKCGRKIRITKKTKKKGNENFAQEYIKQADEAGIVVSLLSKSGLVQDRAKRAVNTLEENIRSAVRYFKDDELDGCLDRHYNLEMLDEKARSEQADGCTIAALQLLNALMLHQRLANTSSDLNIHTLGRVKNRRDNIEVKLDRQWNDITRVDYLPVIVPAIEVIRSIQDEGKLKGLRLALQRLASVAEEIAESYAELGIDDIGMLYNKVMGSQKSDGAFFTLPPTASILARLTLDVCDENKDYDWTEKKTWNDHRAADLACGSGTLIAALLTEMKRRAREHGASTERIGELQKLAVEKVITGYDFNEVSLQLAAAQMIAGNHPVDYDHIGLHPMTYGYSKSDKRVYTGSLELLTQDEILPKINELDHDYQGANPLKSNQIDLKLDNTNIKKDVVKAVSGVRIITMNPPFTNRENMGVKFSDEHKEKLRNRVDSIGQLLENHDPGMEGIIDKNSIRPTFVALAEKCLDAKNGVLSLINPTIALTGTSGVTERKILAERFHIHTILTSHDPSQINLSRGTNINESIVIACRSTGESSPTRIISLDRVPTDSDEVADLHQSLKNCENGVISDGWGEVSEWPREYVESGDWSAALWRSPRLAIEAVKLANMKSLPLLSEQNLHPASTGRILRGRFRESTKEDPSSFPILKSKSAEAQTMIKAIPDQHWAPKDEANSTQTTIKGVDSQEVSYTANIKQKAGYLLITAGQRLNTARLTAVAGEEKYIGNGWLPVSNLTPKKAKAAAVFLNSTAGRLQVMRFPGKMLSFPAYSRKQVAEIRIPDLSKEDIVDTLATCWEVTKNMLVPQYRDGECEVRRLWDEAVEVAMGWDGRDDPNLAELRHLLNNEPYVRGLGYNQYG